MTDKNFLLIDTADGTRALLHVDGKYYYDESVKRAGSEVLLPMIDGLLAGAGAALNGLDILGACVGPGSFTGLRIGLTTIKTFCYALDKPCFAVNNLRLISYNNKSDKVISLADAGNKVCYVARFDGQTVLDQPRCITQDSVREYVKRYPDFAVSTDSKLSGVFGGTAGVGERELKLAAARCIGDEISHTRLIPLYIRKAQPERGEGDL